MHGDLPGSAWPGVFSNRTASLAALIQQLDRTQWLDPEEIRSGQHRQLSRLGAHLIEHNPSFRERLAKAGLDAGALSSPEGLSALPPLTRQQAMAKTPPIFSAAVPKSHQPTSKVNTSGSTGEPVIVHRTAVNQLFWMALTMRYHLWAEPDFNGRIAAIRAHLKEAARSDWGSPVATFFETGPSLIVNMQSDIGVQLDKLVQFRPTSLVVYPSNLVALLDEMEARGIGLPDLKRVRTVGEMLPDGIRERAEAAGFRIYDCYSSEEMGYVTLQCPDHADLNHLMSESLIVEVVDKDGRQCAEGDTGRVLVTDLHNHATPMIRYEIADHAEVGPPCPCGRGLPTLRRILGRERNMMVKPDGTRHWPLTGYKRFREIAPVAQYQFRQHAPERIEVRLVVERPLTGAEETELRDEINQKMRYPFTLDLVYFEGRLPLGANGKFEEFMRLF